jgi:hypothetical protein
MTHQITFDGLVPPAQITFDGLVSPAFRCAHLQISGVNAAACLICGLLAPTEHHLKRLEARP